MDEIKCTIYTSQLYKSNRKKLNDNMFFRSEDSLNITFCESDTLEKFEKDLSVLRKSSFLYSFKKKFSSIFLSVISVAVILFAVISVSIYEDFFKRILFESPFSWEIQDTISFIFVLIFLIGMIMMPSILDGEGSEFKNSLWAWFNKDIRKLKRLKIFFSMFKKTTVINLYNFDLEEKEHWIWRLLIKTLLHRFDTINFYIRNDQIQSIEKKLTLYNLEKKIKIENSHNLKDCTLSKKSDINILLSANEQKLFSLMQLSSSWIINDGENKKFISLELFEYCGKNFLEEKKHSNQLLISGFQNFINRSFDDFYFIKQEKSQQIYFTNTMQYKNLDDEQKSLAYYLLNHIEECITYFNNPISLLILYYYVKDIVLDENRIIKILEKFISLILKNQQYELIDEYWFKLAGKMFDSSLLENFYMSNSSFYRKLSIKSMNQLIFIFERNGHFEQALLLSKYLYEINPSKYDVNICSLLERMGKFDEAYNTLPKNLTLTKNTKPNDIEVRYLQRKAWIIVSQRKNDLKEEGKGALKNLEELLFSHNEDNEPLWLWHYYNIKANYEEWTENYVSAIIYYKKCLAIPTLGAFEYGATFVNMAITYRLKYIEEEMQEMDIINKAIELGEIGVLLKESVGDRDDMPVVLHNQALNMLYKILNISEDESSCKKIVKITSDAICILDKTNSVKRLGMLLIENYISKNLLNEDNKEIVIRLENHLPNLDTNELIQIKEVYQEFRKLKHINDIRFLQP